MILKDELYGEFEIEVVLEELLASPPVQRLKGIYQGGASYFVNETWNVTRYEHSVGVMLLIRKLGGSIEEQIAGMLHDVSHTAFSHVVDYVFDDLPESYHETIYQALVAESEIPGILARYGYDYRSVLYDVGQWGLLERPAPELCADRVDYTLRDMHRYGIISLEEAHAFLESIVVVNGMMCLNRIEAAEWFVRTYYREVIDFFMDPLNIYGYHFLAQALKAALDKGKVTPQTLLGTDEEVMGKLRSTDDPQILELLGSLHRGVLVTEDERDYDLHRKTKLRLIDPSVLHENKRRSASELSGDVRIRNEEAKRKAEKGMYVRIVSSFPGAVDKL